MQAFLLGAALMIALMMALGMGALLRGPSAGDRMMAVQMVGTCGAAICLLVASAADLPAILDVALVMTLLAAFATAAMTLKTGPRFSPKHTASQRAERDGE